MLHKAMTGRLGNQMFQYAAVRAFQEQYAKDTPINLDFSILYRFGTKDEGFCNHLGDFNIRDCYIDKEVELNVRQAILFYVYVVCDRILKRTQKTGYMEKKAKYEVKFQKIFQKSGLYIFSLGYFKFENCRVKNKLFIGNFESSRYFDNIKEELREEFTPRYPERTENEKLYKAIRSSESVCVSIRRGDFLSDKYKANHYVCTPQYFEKAVELMKKKIKNPRFVVFSDDVEWVKENMDFPKNTLFESGNDPVWEKLRLMYNCKHFIISNSTFSWWAQYLSKNDKKVVIAPSRWNNGANFDFIYQDDWIKIGP